MGGAPSAMRMPRVAVLVVLLALGGPLGAQSPTPRERAEEFERQAREAAMYRERVRLFFFAVAEWHEEGARAVLAMDQDRLAHAVRQGDVTLKVAFIARGRACPGTPFEAHSEVGSLLSYVLGQWHGQGRAGLANQAALAERLLEAADRARRNGESCFP